MFRLLLIACFCVVQAIGMQPLLLSLDEDPRITQKFLQQIIPECARLDGSSFRTYGDRFDRPPCIAVLHYTETRNRGGAMEAFRDNGTSAHYVVDQDGDIIQIVPLHHRAFHAGVSRFGDHTSLNGCSIGVEIVNRGLAEHEEPGAVQLLGDGRWWFPFPPEQTRAVGLLVQALQARFRIPGWNVVGHMEIALGRKSDPGPLLDYRTLFVDYHGGFFPSEDPIVNRMEFLERLVEDDYHAILSLIGYRPPEGQWSLAIKAYQMHFSRGNISGELVEETKESLIHFVLDIHSYRDPYTGTRHTSFIAEFHTLVWTAPERFDPFFQHIPSLQAGE